MSNSYPYEITCPKCGEHETRVAEKWSGSPLDGPDQVIYCPDIKGCGWEEYV